MDSQNNKSGMFKPSISVKILLFLSIITLLSFNEAIAQGRKICFLCKKNITCRYISADGKTYHPEHFLCASCGKIIEKEYQSKDGKFFHPGCYLIEEGMICDYCKKILEEDYTVSSGKRYHTECYVNFILPKCSICGLPIKGSFLIDSYKNRYHSDHKREYNQCDCCGRLICASLTGGGRDYSDGRHICNICFSSAVTDARKFNELLIKVINRLKNYGIILNDKQIGIFGVDRHSLKRRDINYSDDTRGYCDSQTRTETVNGRVTKKVTSHIIYILSGMPQVLTESTIAHELMHAWLFDNTENEHSDPVREGSCNFISYLYLTSLDSPEAAEVIKMLESDPSPVYGRGFLEIRSRFGVKPIERFLDYLRN